MRIILTKFGFISEIDISIILKILYETFDSLQPHDREIVDLFLFKTSSLLNIFLQQEHQKLGVVSDRFDEDFIAVHDAWRGIPRISVSIERLKQLPQKVVVGALRHEVGHAVLHGEISYYLLPKPEAFDKFNMSGEYIANLLYLISIAVKDYEVTKLLILKGFEKDLKAYISHLLIPSDVDSTTWLIARKKKSTLVLSVVSYLKQLCSVVALNLKRSKQLHIQDIYPFLPEKIVKKLKRISYEVQKFPLGKTAENIKRLARLITEEMSEYLEKV